MLLKPSHLASVLCLVMTVSACATVNRSIFDPKLPVRTRVLPLEIHIMDPNVDGTTELGDKPQPLLSNLRIMEARYVILKDFNRNVFEPGDQKWGHLIVRVGRNASLNWAWFVPSTLSMYVVNLVGFPILSQSSEVTLDIEVLDARRRHVTKFTAKGRDTEYSALYWGYSWRAFAGVRTFEEVDNTGNQTVHAKALRGALDDAKRELEKQANTINARLRAAKT